MKNKLKILSFLLVLAVMVTGCGNKEEGKITIVLDWTPNTNHTGIYVALGKGYFEEEGLDVEIVQPPEGGAPQLVGSGKAEFGIDFQDLMAPAFAKEDPLPVTAVATLIQHNTSGIISLKGNGIESPKGMSNKTYTTWDSPVEKAIIKSVVEADGGDYDSITMIPNSVTDVITALNTDIDAVWIFYAWDGIATKVKGEETDYFAFKDIQPVFDYYAPILIGNNDYLEENGDEARKVLKAIARGYEYAIENPEDAAKILVEASPELDMELVLESQKWLANEYKSEVSQWGFIDGDRWDGFYSWLFEENLIEQEIPSGFGFTNDYLPE